MSISVTCGNASCGKSFRVKDEYAGKTGKCPGCGQTLRIPAAAAPPPLAKAPKVESRASVPLPSASPLRAAGVGDDAAPAVNRAPPSVATAPRRSSSRRWLVAAAALTVVAGGVALAVFWKDLFPADNSGEQAQGGDDGAADPVERGKTPQGNGGDGQQSRKEDPAASSANAATSSGGSTSGASQPPPEPMPVEPLPDAELAPLPVAEEPKFAEYKGVFKGLDIGQGQSASTIRCGEKDYPLWIVPADGTAKAPADALAFVRGQVVIAKVNAHNRGMDLITAGDTNGATTAFMQAGRLERLSADPTAIERVAGHLALVADLGLEKEKEYRLEGTLVEEIDGSQEWLVVTKVDDKQICTHEQALAQRVENPEYVRWASFQPGAAATLRMETTISMQTYVSEQTVTLVEADAAHVQLKTITAALPRRPEVEETVTQQRVPRFIIAAHERPAETVESGEEQLASLKLAWAKTRKAWKDAEDRDREWIDTTWTSDWVPGKIVRRKISSDFVDPATGLKKTEDHYELIAVSGPGTEEFARAWAQHRLAQAGPQIAELEATIKSQDKLAAAKALAAVVEQAGDGPAVQALRQRVEQLPWPKRLTFDLGGETKEKLVLVRIPAGSFQMGSANGEANEQPVHKVTFSKVFYMSETEVTEGQWKAITGSYIRNPNFGRPFQGDKHPVDGLSFGPIDDFLKALGTKLERPGQFRIPTEAEWEYACKAGGTTDYSFGDAVAQLGDYAWFKDNAGDDLHPVAQKKPNAWGLYDMHGNALEWCSDAWRENYEGDEVTDPRPQRIDGYRSEPVAVRGGSWNDDAKFCRSASRRALNCGKLINEPDVGFRIVFQP